MVLQVDPFPSDKYSLTCCETTVGRHLKILFFFLIKASFRKIQRKLSRINVTERIEGKGMEETLNKAEET